MRTPTLIVALFGICASAGSLTAQTPAATPARNHSLSLYATVGASGGATKAKADVKVELGDSVYAEERNYTKKREAEDAINLKVEVRNIAKVPDSVKLEWFFYGRDVKGGAPFIFDGGSQEVNVGPVATTKIDLQSKPLVSKVEKKLYSTEGVDDAGFNPSFATTNKSGQKAVAWIVRISDGPKVLAVRASSQTYETLGRTVVMPTPTPAPARRR